MLTQAIRNIIQFIARSKTVFFAVTAVFFAAALLVSYGEPQLENLQTASAQVSPPRTYCAIATSTATSTIRDLYVSSPYLYAIDSIGRVERRFLENLLPDPAYGENGVVQLPHAALQRAVVATGSGSVYSGSGSGILALNGCAGRTWELYKDDLAYGAPVSAWNGDGMAQTGRDSAGTWDYFGMATDATYAYYVGPVQTNPTVSGQCSMYGLIERYNLATGARSYSTRGNTPWADVALDSSYMYVAGKRFVTEKRYKTGATIYSVGGTGVGFWGGAPEAETIALDTANRAIYVGGSTGYKYSSDPSLRWQIQKRATVNMGIDPAFGAGGTLLGDPETHTVYRMAVDSAGGYLYAVGTENNDAGWRIEKLDIRDGSRDGSFGTGGVIRERSGSALNERPKAIAIDAANGFFYVGGIYKGTWRLEKRNLSDGDFPTCPDIMPPAPAGNVRPVDGATNVNQTAALVAQTATDETPPVEYRFELYRGTTCFGTPVRERDFGRPSSWAVSSLAPQTDYAWHVQVRDSADPPNQSTGPCWTFKTGGVVDLLPPARSNGRPSGALPAGATSATLSLRTDEPATCRYSVNPGEPYDAMGDAFAMTGSMNHRTDVSGLEDATIYQYYVKCRDQSDNENADDYVIAFSVGVPIAGTGQSWAWSANLGWISFTCENLGTCVDSDYRVSFDAATGELSGHAWSSGVGWLSFERSETGDPPSDDVGGGSGPIAKAAGGRVAGWARFLGACATVPCASADPGVGGWDGWVRLRDDTALYPYGILSDPASPDDLMGFAWGSDVTGWISFNCKDPDVCAASDYRVSFADFSGPDPGFDVDLTASPNPAVRYGRNPVRVTLTATVSHNDASKPLTYAFDCDNGESETFSKLPGDPEYNPATFECTYDFAKNYTARVTSTQEFGSIDADVTDVEVIKVRPFDRKECNPGEICE